MIKNLLLQSDIKVLKKSQQKTITGGQRPHTSISKDNIASFRTFCRRGCIAG